MTREKTIAAAALAFVALYLVFNVAGRLHEGRCRLGAGRAALSCGYPAGSYRLHP